MEQQQQIFVIKQSLVNNCKTHYRAFLESFLHLPAHQFQKQQALINFDQGMMWLTEAIMNSQIELKNVEQPVQEERNAVPAEGEPEGQPVSQPEVDQTQETQPVSGE